MSAPPSHVDLLLVDDRAANLLALEAILEGPDYRLVTASSGQEALDAVARHDFALILLDVAMPGMTGLDVADRLKKDERTRTIPILFVTAVATGMDDIYRAYDVGAVDYLIKPLDTRAVRAKVAVFADLYRQRRQIEHQAQLLRETERREHELRMAELRVASDERYRKLVEGIDHAFGWSGDPDANHLSFVSGRATAILGYPLEELAEPGFVLDHVPAEERDAVRRAFEAARSGKRDEEVVHRLRAADGSFRWFHTGVSVTVDPLDGRVELHGLSVDVTQLKEAEQEAARATQARDEVMQVVAHDLRNPMGSVLMHAQRARKALAAGEATGPVIEWIERIERAAHTMERLIGDLTDLEQLETGHMSMDHQPHDVTALLSEAVAELEPLARAKSTVLCIDADPVRGVLVRCDRGRILQVLSNLVGNAIKFSPQHAPVRVAARLDGEMVRFAVTDAGAGIEPTQLPMVFGRYWQAKEWARMGVGLGLTIAKGLVQAHEGQIWVESERGKGSTFTFTLRVAVPEGRAAAS